MPTQHVSCTLIADAARGSAPTAIDGKNNFLGCFAWVVFWCVFSKKTSSSFSVLCSCFPCGFSCFLLLYNDISSSASGDNASKYDSDYDHHVGVHESFFC